MTAGYLVGLAIGPVQPFIEAARRTRDLWYGSTILSGVGKAAASALRDAGAELVFPSPADPAEELKPNSDFIAANRIIAFCLGVDLARAKKLLQVAKDAATSDWDRLARERKAELDAVDPAAVHSGRWSEQIGDVLELYGACKGVADMSEFREARERLDELLASRKNTRNFEQTSGEWKGIAKSALDGARESVLVARSVRVRRFLGMERDEALDAVGLVKRIGGRDEKFTPLTRIAADEWLLAFKEHARTNLRREYEQLVTANVGSAVRGNERAYKDFPFDCQWLYRGRLEKALYDLRKDQDEAEARAALERFHEVVKGVWKDHGEPSPYVAMLMADGDRMGAMIGGTIPMASESDLQVQQRISRALSDFASAVRHIVRKHRGHAVYAGGDDVLAMLPGTRAVACARELEMEFAKALEEFGDGKARPTLSVGIAVRHVLDPLGTLRRDAARALKIAKEGREDEDIHLGEKRNALAILLAPRSGAPVVARGQWREEDLPPLDERLSRWCDAFREGLLSSAAVYDLREVAKLLEDEPTLSRREAKRVLERKQGEAGTADERSKEGVRQLKQDLGAVIDHLSVRAVVTELLIARHLVGLER